MNKLFIIALAVSLQPLALPATPVMFPLAQMFANAQYARAFTVTAQYPEVTDGTNIYVGTSHTVTPNAGTNPIVNLTPNNYLLTFQDARTPLRFSVPITNGVVNLLNLITNGLMAVINWNPATGISSNTTLTGKLILGAPDLAFINESWLAPFGADQAGIEFWVTNNSGSFNRTMYIDDDSVVISGDLSLANYQILSMGLIKGANFQEYGGLFGTDGSGDVNMVQLLGTWWPWMTDNSSGVVFGSGVGGNGDAPQYTWLINSTVTAAKLNNAGLTVYGPVNLGSSLTANYVSTNGAGGSATVWIQTNSVGPHGVGLNFTNGLFILPVKTY